MVLLDLSLTDPKIIAELSEGEEAFLCYVCKSKITEKKFLINVSEGTPFHTFSNPYGFSFRVMTVSYAEMVKITSEPELENTWFPGYSWAIIQCQGCMEHLGWKYTSSDKEPANFYGFIRDKLVLSI